MTRRRAGLSVRVRLALSYAAFLVLAGIVLFAVGFLLLRFVPEGSIIGPDGTWAPNRADLLEVFVRYAWWSLALLLLLGLAGGWLLAGWMLAPLRRITATVRRASRGELDVRVELPGRRDELTELADTFDAMLARVGRTLEEERRFAANASHELRTPHAVIRTMVEVARADPQGRDVDLLLERLALTNDRAIASIEALLLLARVGRGEGLPTERVDLAEIARSALDDIRGDLAHVRVESALRPAPARASTALTTRIVENLVRNAATHNTASGGWVHLATGRTAHGDVMLTIANSGEIIAPAAVPTLIEPFVRGEGRVRRTGAEGAGLGLAIVVSATRAQGGSHEITALAGGGLRVRITLPAV